MKKVHLICNAHIDPIWQWDWQEGVSAMLSTFQSAVNLAEKHDYVFCHNEAVVYKYVEAENFGWQVKTPQILMNPAIVFGWDGCGDQRKR